MHDEVEVILILEGVEHIDDEFMAEEGEELSLVEDRLYTAFCDYSECIRTVHGFGHFLHGVESVTVEVLDFPDFSKAAFADHVEVSIGLFC